MWNHLFFSGSAHFSNNKYQHLSKITITDINK
jgi:hypothetical protein